MKSVSSLTLLALLSLGVLALAEENVVSRAATGGKARVPGVREVAALLQQTLETDGFQGPMSLKESLALLQEKVKQRGGELPIHVDQGAFKEENPEGAAIYDTQVSFPEFPRQMKLAHFLYLMLSRVDPPNATFLIRPGYVEITTISNADISRLLGQAVHVSFNRTPLALALEELYQSTGVPVILDTRAWRQAKKPISANFTNNPSLGGVLLVLSEMGGLKLLIGDNMIYLTTPAHARQLLRERMWVPYHMQSEGPGSMAAASPFGGYRQKRVE
jgi:hypothetical protein